MPGGRSTSIAGEASVAQETVIGCWLVEQGLAGDEAIARIAKLRKHTPDGPVPSPENEEQRRYICEWLTPR